MNDPTIHLRIVGATLLVLAVAHICFGRHLEWRADASRLSAINRQIFHTHTFFICLILAMMGVLCLFYTQTLMTPTPLARVILFGLTLFWAVRLLFQWLFSSESTGSGSGCTRSFTSCSRLFGSTTRSRSPLRYGCSTGPRQMLFRNRRIDYAPLRTKTTL